MPGVNSVTRRCKRGRLRRGRVPWFWHGSFARYVGLVRTKADRAAEFAEGLALGGGSGTPDGLQLTFGRIVDRVRQVPGRDVTRGLCVPQQDDGATLPQRFHKGRTGEGLSLYTRHRSGLCVWARRQGTRMAENHHNSGSVQPKNKPRQGIFPGKSLSSKGTGDWPEVCTLLGRGVQDENHPDQNNSCFPYPCRQYCTGFRAGRGKPKWSRS